MTLFLTNDVTATQASSHRDPVSRNPSDLAGGKTCVSSARHTLHVKQIVSCFCPIPFPAPSSTPRLTSARRTPAPPPPPQ
ncbi:GM22432 [Drosophila sechellia]|uniref:GM22432 n=1 Tax=Drosophila sechellia TaxID=7238 RepID=B4IAY9_DROSE|nr:GM22432 [Drosophila sechellia]